MLTRDAISLYLEYTKHGEEIQCEGVALFDWCGPGDLSEEVALSTD